jgi:hypothetical protein
VWRAGALALLPAVATLAKRPESPSPLRRLYVVWEGEIGCAPVRMLGVAGNNISSEGATEVAKMLAGSTALTSIDLHSEYLWRWKACAEGRQSGSGWLGSRRGAGKGEQEKENACVYVCMCVCVHVHVYCYYQFYALYG